MSQSFKTVWKETVAFLKSLVGILLIAFFIRFFVIEPFKIPSSSMVPTLQIGDYILVLKYSYGISLPFVTYSPVQWDSPQRRDVVVFTRPDDPKTPEDDSDKHIIKRVIGIAGDKVEVRGTQVFVNGEAQDEPYARWANGGNLEGYFGPMTVPEGHIFLMGDNRDHSLDSRFWSEHFLDVRRVKGRAVLVFWSLDEPFSRIAKAIR